MTRPCRKTTYRNKVAALLTLAEIRHKDRSSAPVLEQRAYHCTTCHGWHLTSQPRRTA